MRFLIRADASVTIGTGHVMRCLALAQGLRRAGGEAVVALAEITPALEARLAAAGVSTVRVLENRGSMADARATVALAREARADWVVADGYCFDTAFQELVRGNGFRLLLVTDVSFPHLLPADFVLNQNLHAAPSDYPRAAPHTRLLLGSRYVILREEFAAWRDRAYEIRQPGRRVLVTLGGSDPDNVTRQLVAALIRLEDAEITIVIGGSNPHRAGLEAQAIAAPGRLRCIVDATDMPQLMTAADVVVAAGGSTCWELAFLGVPTALVVLADNQAAVARRLASDGVMVLLGEAAALVPDRIAAEIGALLHDPQRRADLSRKARRIVDGRGLERIVTELEAAALDIRPATADDCRLVWQWANAPAVREASFHSAPIPWETHVAWYGRRLADAATLFLIAVFNGESVGQIRFETRADGAVISVSLAPGQPGRGLGSALIRLGCARWFERGGAAPIHAYIRPTNLRSIRAFEKAGFACQPPATVEKQPSCHLLLPRNSP